jgi:MFS family permease
VSLFRNRGFVLLAAGQTLGLLGDWGLRTALLIWVYALTHSGVAVSLVGLAEALPLLLLAPVAGVFVDRWDRARTMAGAVLARALLLAPLLAVHDRAGLPLLLVVTLLLNAASQFFMPAASAALPTVVGRERVGQANGLLQMTGSFVPVVAPGLASAIYALAGPHLMVVAIACLYLATIPLLAMVPAPRPDGAKSVRASVGSEMLAGLRYLRRSPLLVRMTVMAFVALLGVGGLSVLDVVFVTRALHLHSETVGVLFTVYGAGNLVGGTAIWLLSPWAARRYHLLLGLSTAILGVSTFCYAIAPSLLLASCALFVNGLVFPTLITSWMTMMQTVTEDAYMGRVMSLANMVMAVAMIVSLSGSGALTDAFGVRPVIGLGAAILLSSGLLSLALIRATPEPPALDAPEEEPLLANAG